MNRYGKFIATHPYVVVGAVLSLTGVCVTTSLILGKFPDFTDPQLGFETRGTEIARRLTTWANIQKGISASGPLEINPAKDYLLKTTTPRPKNWKNVAATPRSVALKARKAYRYWDDIPVADGDVGRVAWSPKANASHSSGATERLAETLEEDDWSSLKRPTHFHDDDDEDDDHDHNHVSADGFFCEQLGQAYSHLVVVANNPSDSLFSLDGLLGICRLQRQLMDVNLMGEACQTIRKGKCCPPWSLANYVAMLRNKTDCLDITENDVRETVDSLKDCHTQLSAEMLDSPKSNKTVCSPGDGLYNMLYYLSDTRYQPGVTALDTSMIFLPIARTASLLPYWQMLDANLLQNDFVNVPAADFGAKGALFDLHLVRGTILMAGASMFIVVCLWTYTGSFFFTLSSICAILMSLLIAHFLYTCAFSIAFFPFINLLAVVLAIGIGADDAFIYCKIWSCVRQDSSGGTISLVSSALRSAAPSMVVTSLTTAAALFANCISPITAINCFSLFAGSAVLVNLLLMLSWLPACVVIADSWASPPFVPLSWRPKLNSKLRTIKECTAQIKGLIDRMLLQCVVWLRWLWVVVLGGLAVAAAVVVLHYPKLRLPDSKNFPLFESSHPFEQYEKFKNFFWFERDPVNNPNEENSLLPLQFVWGVIPLDNGNHLDPMSRGELVFDPTFDITAKESQSWLLQFCANLREQPFYYQLTSPLQIDCFMERFKKWMQRRCKGVSGEDYSPCCEISNFPFTRRVFNKCAALAVASLYNSPRRIFQPTHDGPKFSRGNSRETLVMVVEYDSNYTYSNSMTEMGEFYEIVENWYRDQLLTAPPGLRNGWFVSDLGFFDLQSALSDGTDAAIALSMTVALIVVFLTTLNALVSMFTVLTIAACIFVTVSILVLIGWRLNVLESVAVTTAIGLSVDFSLHYAVHYRQSDEQQRQPAVVHALTRMSGPTAMGALTTGAAGAFMLLSSVLPYIQIGVLLVVLMIVSWIYSTVFLMALLAIAGPEKDCGQFKRPSPGSWCEEPGAAKPTVPAMWSDTTLSTSSGVAEMHELEALTRGQRQRRRRPRAQSPALPEDIEDEMQIQSAASFTSS